jgi:aspartokinase
LDLLKIISEQPKVFHTFSQGISETTIIIANSILEYVEDIFKDERMISKEENLSSITLILPEENQMIYGIYYYILKDLAWFGINLAEIISTSNEFTLIVDDKNLDQTFSILMKLKGT